MENVNDIVGAWDTPAAPTEIKKSALKMTDCMIDLETIDNIPSASIASIGACMFNHEGIGAEFYLVVDTKSCLDLGMTSSEATLAWWSQQSPQARRIFDADTPKVDIRFALSAFYDWFKAQGAKELWGNGSDFDNVIMSWAYRVCGMKQPWSFTNNRCFRTIKDGMYIPKRTGVYHNALDDAKTQAQFMIDKRLAPNRTVRL